MKTPREILFERHKSAEPKLDSVRVEALASAFPDATRNTEQGLPVRAAFKLWRELIWPCRRVWISLAAVWLVLLLFNFSRDNRAQTIAKNSPPPGPAVAAALQEQRRLFARMLEPIPRTPAVSPKTPGPRGALPPIVKIA